MTRSTCILLVLLTLMSVLSLFVGAADITPADVLSGDIESLELMLISRLPRLLAILCTGMGMSIAGLIMQQLCANKFVSPTTGATISSAQFGILIALLFFPDSTLWSRALFAFAAAILGTWTFVWFILRMPMKDPVMVPLVGIMFGNVIGGVTNFLAYRFDMTQALSTWLVGHFSLVLRGNFELVYLVLPLIVLAWIFAKHFNIVGVNSVVNDVLELESDKIIARIRAEFADELEQTKEQLEEAREETAKTKEIIRLLRAGKGISEVADALQISKDKVNEIAELLK